MPPAQSELPDLFQEGIAAGVKELFESYEDALLPVSLQLQKYKKRDLYTSHFHRTSCKVFGPRKHVRKVHIVDSDPFDLPAEENSVQKCSQFKLPKYYATTPPPQKEYIQSKSPTCLTVADNRLESHKLWVEDRRKLRNDLNSFGLNVAWLKQKTDKNSLEKRVLKRLQMENGQTMRNKNKVPPSKNRSQLKHTLPFDVNVAIEKMCRFLKQNNLLLKDIFPGLETSLKISKAECKEGLHLLQKMSTLLVEDVETIVDFFFNKSSLVFGNVASDILSKRSQPKLNDCITIKEPERIEKSTSPTKATTIDRKALRIKEYQTAMQLCKENGIILDENILKRALLIPDDIIMKSNFQAQTIRKPGECLSKDFWKQRHRSEIRKKRLLYKMQKHSSDEKITSLYMASFSTVFTNGSISTAQLNSDTIKEERLLPTTTHSYKSSHDTLDILSLPSEDGASQFSASLSSSSSDAESEGEQMLVQCSAAAHPNKLPEKHKTPSSDSTDSSTGGKRTPSEGNLFKFPRLRDVAPERCQMNLTTGRATISRKIDCWLTYEDYEKLTCAEPVLRRERSFPNAFWPGHMLDKLRLCMPSCEDHNPQCRHSQNNNSLFQYVDQRPHYSQRSNKGYDNNLRTWPNDGKYIKYGSVDQDKVYHI